MKKKLNGIEKALMSLGCKIFIGDEKVDVDMAGNGHYTLTGERCLASDGSQVGLLVRLYGYEDKNPIAEKYVSSV